MQKGYRKNAILHPEMQRMQMGCREDTNKLPRMQGMRNGCRRHADIFILDARHPFLSILLYLQMTSNTGCKGCQKDASLHPQL